jgi:4-amino-4-deoxychorismate lyase
LRMEKFISKDFQVLKATQANIRAFSSVLLYGYGIFTTVAVYNQQPFQWERHWKRLMHGAQKLKLQMPEEEKIKNQLLELIEKNHLKQGKVRITIFEEEIEDIWAVVGTRRTSVLITTAQFREVPSEMKLKISSHRVNSKSALKGIKSCNYLENLLAFEEAKSEGFDEALRLNENDQITSACMANIFWIDNETVFTPSLDTGCLEGTTRAFVIEICRDLGIEVFTANSSLDEILRADEIFLTSSGIGIIPVRKVENNLFTTELTKVLQREFYKRIS